MVQINQRQGDHSPEKYPTPTLPDHLDRLIDLPWAFEASIAIDHWLWWHQQEFEGVQS